MDLGGLTARINQAIDQIDTARNLDLDVPENRRRLEQVVRETIDFVRSNAFDTIHITPRIRALRKYAETIEDALTNPEDPLLPPENNGPRQSERSRQVSHFANEIRKDMISVAEQLPTRQNPIRAVRRIGGRKTRKGKSRSRRARYSRRR